MRSHRTLDLHLDYFSTFCGLWICYMLLQGILFRNNSLYIRNKTLSDFVRPGYECAKYSAANVFYPKSSQPYIGSFYLYLKENQLLFIITLSSIGSTISDPGTKKKPLGYHNLGPEFHKVVLGSELTGRVFPHGFYLTVTEYLLTSPHILIVILLYNVRYKLIIVSTDEIRLVNWKHKKAEKNPYTMLPSFVILSLTALAISTVTGLFTNSFIIVAHGMEKAKSRNINPRELILFTLGLFNIAYQFSMAANDSVLYLWSDIYFSDNVYTIFSILLLFTIFSSFWFTFCLCGFYYVMLVTVEQTFFIRLKQSISEIVPWMLLSSVLLSLIISVPVAWNIKQEDYIGQLEGNITDNATIHHYTPHMSLEYLLVTSIIGCCIPLILVAMANVLIIKALYVHSKQLQKNMAGKTVQSVEASVSAAYTVTSLLLLYISFYISQILLIMAVFDVDSIWFSVCLVVIYAYSPVQSIILIFGSPKLKSNLIKCLGSLVHRKTRFPNENIKVIS